MQKVLNILNGDATLAKFRRSGLPGDIIVWREILSEGPVTGDNGEFFRTREEWLSHTFDLPAGDYHSKVIKEFNRLKEEQGYFDEIILWFEFDLTCQINLLFLLDFFQKERRPNQLSLVCPAEFPGYPNFKGIGELKPEKFAQLREQKIELTEQDLEIAANAWQAYRSGQAQVIEQFLKDDHGQLRMLRPALQAHLERFPDQDGLNRIDRELLKISRAGVSNKVEIFQRFSNNAKIYGMTDLSVFWYLDKLKTAGLIKL